MSMYSNIELLSLDLDGTLLNKNGDISERNLTALKEASDQGIEIVFCTGRPYQFVQSMLAQYKISYPAICSNGAIIVSKNGDVIRKIGFPSRLFEKLYDFLMKRGFYVEIDSASGSYTDAQIQSNMRVMMKEVYPKAREDQIVKATQRKINNGDIQYVPHAVQTFKQEEVLKLFVYDPRTEKIAKLKKEMAAFYDLVEITESGGSDNLEITLSQITKASGLSVYASYGGYLLKNTASIGDSFNDIGMFEVSGLAIAMKNADPSIFAYCDAVIGDHEMDGVAEFIHQIMSTNLERR